MLLKSLLREPLFHFLFAGLLLFVIFDVVGGNRGRDGAIVIDDPIVADIAQRYEAAWQRPPTAKELRGLVDSYVRDEILYRAGVENGLDRDDPVIKRRVRQKLDVIAEESARQTPPTRSELEAWLKANRSRYALPPIVSFTQVFIDPTQHGAATEARIATVRTALAGGADPGGLSDSQLMPASVTASPLDLVARDFGEEFTRDLERLPVGPWSGPVRSGYGLHLVRIDALKPGRTARLDEVRPAVERDWENERRIKAADSYYKDLRSRYDVRIESKLLETAGQSR